LKGRTRHLPWLVVGAVAALLVPSAAFAEPPPLTATFTAVDPTQTTHVWRDSVSNTNATTIATSGTVTFDYPVGAFPNTVHNVNFTSANKPSTCQRIGGAAGAPPIPSPAIRAPWTVSCTFDTPGTYAFNCQIHPTMTGTITVTGDSKTTVPAGNVPATLSLGIGTSASLGTFALGVATDYLATVNANVTSSAGDATLTVFDGSANAPGHLVNGAYVMAQALQVKATNAANPNTAFAAVPAAAGPLTLLTWGGPVANDAVIVSFKQTVGATDPLRTGTYGKTLTFTLSTTAP
jgi:plastocyanin